MAVVQDPDDVIAESRRLARDLAKLAAKLEVLTDQIETALARHEEEDEGDGRPDPS